MKYLAWLIISIFLFVVLVRYIESHSIFYPMKEMFSDPKRMWLSYEDVFFKTRDGISLHGWFIPSGKPSYTVIFCHGNAGNISHRIDKAAILRDLGLNIFLFDYRGYGKSAGAPNESGLYEDIDAAYDHLVRERGIRPENILAYGESIGASVAIDLASRKKIGGLIAEEAFTSIKEMSGIAFPVVPYFIFSNKFDSLSKITRVECPKLFIHSVDDEIVPHSMGMRLFEAAKEPKKFLRIRGSHNTAFLDSEEAFRNGLQSFLKEALKGVEKSQEKADLPN